MCFILCHYSSINSFLDPERTPSRRTKTTFFQDKLLAFSSSDLATEETLLSCFLPSLALKLASALLICVGHNTGKHSGFLLHHFLGANRFQQCVHWKCEVFSRYVLCDTLIISPIIYDTHTHNRGERFLSLPLT